jgi:stringent starvation protein B
MKGPEHGSTRPYLIRALYEWCTDNGLTPYVAVQVDESVQVPREFVKNNEIVLNISFDATSSLKLGNEFIEFKARFGGVAREIIVPIERVIAIYARENGQGMAFPAAPLPTSAGPEPLQPQPVTGTALALANPPASGDSKVSSIVPEAGHSGDQPPPQPPKPSPGRPSLKRIK